MIRILHIDTEKGFRGGEQQVVNLMEGLRSLGGFEQLALVRKGHDLGKVLRSKNFQTVEIEKSKPLPVVGVKPVQNLVKDFNPDIVHAHTGNSHTLAYRAFRKLYPIIVSRRVDFALKQNFLSKKKYHHSSTIFVAISTKIQEILKEGGVDQNRIHIIPSGVDPKRFLKDGSFPDQIARKDWRAKWNTNDETTVFGMVGSFVDHKDPKNLVSAASELPKMKNNGDHSLDFRVVLIGDGELRGELESQIKELELDQHVFLTGWQEQVGEAMSGLDVFVMPSKLEGLCTSLIDAQAVGLPCVASNAGGIPDVIVDRETGLLAEAQNPKALAEKMIKITQNTELKKQMIQNGKQRVLDRFTIDSMTQSYAELYQKIRK